MSKAIPLNYEDEEAVADRLLQEAGAHIGPSPAYSESYLAARDRRRARDFSEEELFQESGLALQPSSELFDVCKGEILAGCHYLRLPRGQVRIVELRIEGLSIREIAAVLDLDKNKVDRLLTAAVKRLPLIPHFGLWSVLAEVFRLRLGEVQRLCLETRRRGGGA